MKDENLGNITMVAKEGKEGNLKEEEFDILVTKL